MNEKKPQWTISKEVKFEAAHKLPHHDGACARLHGHSFKARIICAGDRLQQEGPKQGMLLDFKSISAVVNPIVESKLDHQYLNDTLSLLNPTSEAIAAWLFYELKPQLPSLVAIEVDETCTSSCRFEVTQ